MAEDKKTNQQAAQGKAGAANAEKKSAETTSAVPEIKPGHVTVIGTGKAPELWEGREVPGVPTADAEALEEMGAVKIKW